MFKYAFVGKTNERLGLSIAMVIFALVALVQMYRALTGLSLELGDYSLPSWFSVIAGIGALLMSFWMGAELRKRHQFL